MIFIGVNEPFAAFSSNQFTPLTYYLYLKHISVDSNWLFWAIEVNVMHDKL